MTDLPLPPDAENPSSAAPAEESPTQPQPPALDLQQPSFFESYSRSSHCDPERIPHFGHILLLLPLMLLGWLASALLAHFALRLHLYGITTPEKAVGEVHYALGTMAVFYLVTFVTAVFVFPLFWQRSFFDGIEWRIKAIPSNIKMLLGATGLCFILAISDQLIIPGPDHAPINDLFHTSTEAWMLFCFGITLAPFFEEMAFRGFLLPSFATAVDWMLERTSAQPRLPLTESCHPQWSRPAMIAGAGLTSLPFALIHGYQTGYSLGPFLLLYVVSMLLCWIRLRTRSLAASTFVHATYNLIIFLMLLIGTGGFQHFDKL